MEIDKEVLIDEDDKSKIFTGFFPSTCGEEKIYFKRKVPKYIDESAINIVIVHDAGEYHGRHFHLSNYLTKKSDSKFITTWIDLKGHGLSSGTRGHISNLSEYSNDLAFYFKNNNSIYDKYRTCLIGHGLGALVALDFFRDHEEVAKNKITCCILSNPYIKFKVETPVSIDLLLTKWSNLFSKVRLPIHLNGFNVTSDIEEAENYNCDPLINKFITLSLFREIQKVSKEVRKLSYYLEHSCLFLLGGKDPFSSAEKTKLFIKGMPKNKGEYLFYENMGHDLFNEIGRDRMFNDIYNWLNKKFK